MDHRQPRRQAPTRGCLLLPQETAVAQELGPRTGLVAARHPGRHAETRRHKEKQAEDQGGPATQPRGRG